MTAASDVRNFRSIITLIVFILTNTVVVFPFHVPIPIPSSVQHGTLSFLSAIRVLRPRTRPHKLIDSDVNKKPKYSIFRFPVNFATAPVIAVLFLLACTAIHRREVHDGILGSDGIVPISIMAFFIALAYIAISLDQTGLIRFVAVWVLRKGGGNGRRLYLYLYIFYISLATLFGNDPVILSATPFIAYMTKASVNIENPRAWIYAQFACANIASAILVSSNPTNLVLSGAFDISYVTYTANMIIPTAFTALILFPILLYFVFPSEKLIPRRIEMHVLPDEKPPASTAPGVTANGTINLSAAEPIHMITRAATGQSGISHTGITRTRTLTRKEEVNHEMDLEELLNPHLHRPAAIFCCILFVVTLAVLLATNAAGAKVEVYAITVPAAFVMLCRDMIDDWIATGREEREQRKGDLEAEGVPATNSGRAANNDEKHQQRGAKVPTASRTLSSDFPEKEDPLDPVEEEDEEGTQSQQRSKPYIPQNGPVTEEPEVYDPDEPAPTDSQPTSKTSTSATARTITADTHPILSSNKTIKGELGQRNIPRPQTQSHSPSDSHASLESIVLSLLSFLTSRFPRACKVISQLPFPLLPFTFGMFILVQGLVTKGWVQIFANGWQGWVHKTGTLGAIGGMGLVSVLLCNFAGTNIGATIVLSRVLQEWLSNHTPSDRTKQASIYALAIGVNYGAFSLAFSASLAALLWKAILERKGIRVRALDFARYNVPIIFVCMTVGCGILAAQVFIVKDGNQTTT